MRKRKRAIPAAALVVMALADLCVATAYADTLSVIYYDGSTYLMGGGDVFRINDSPPGWPNFTGEAHIAFVYANGTPIFQLDTMNSDVKNGYLAIYPSSVSSWVNALQGNLAFVQSQIQSQQFSVWDQNTNGVTQFVPFATVVNESGAIFTGNTVTPNGGTYKDPKTGKTYPTYRSEWTVSPSSPPVATGLSATVNGGSVTLHFTNSVSLWSQLAAYHYDQITITDANGRVVWQPRGVTNVGIPGVQVESGTQYSSRTDDITVGTLPPGTYTVTASVWDGVDRHSNTVTMTLVVNGNGGGGGSSGGNNLPKDQITLTANPTNLPVGQTSTLTATTGGLSNGDAWGIIIDDVNGDGTLNGSNEAWSDMNVTTFNASATSQKPLTDTYVAHLVDTVTWQLIDSNTVTVTWTNNGGSGGGNGGTGGGSGSGGSGGGSTGVQCPAPYDSDVHWVNLGNGDQELVWTRHDPQPIYQTQQQCTMGPNGQRQCQTVQVFAGCDDRTTQMSKVYMHSVSNGQISGLSYDPGTPNYMWLPVPASQWNPYQGASSIWGPLDAKHGWTGLETGGPDANQISSNVWIDGQLFHTYGPPIGTQTPTVWVRAGGGFGFRYVWNGSPDAIPTGGTVTFTMTNPDGGSITWTKPLILNTETLYTAGTDLVGLNQPPPEASEVFSCWTDIPKGVYKNGQPEEAAWSLSNDWQTAYNNGAHISVSITVDTPAGSFTVSAPNVASTFSYPAWWFTRLASDNLLQDMQKWEQSLQLGTIYGDPSVGLPPAPGTH